MLIHEKKRKYYVFQFMYTSTARHLLTALIGRLLSSAASNITVLERVSSFTCSSYKKTTTIKSYLMKMLSFIYLFRSI